jgi:hypothetical protein
MTKVPPCQNKQLKDVILGYLNLEIRELQHSETSATISQSTGSNIAEAFREFSSTVLRSKQERSTSCTEFHLIPHREHKVFRLKSCVYYMHYEI